MIKELKRGFEEDVSRQFGSSRYRVRFVEYGIKDKTFYYNMEITDYNRDGIVEDVTYRVDLQGMLDRTDNFVSVHVAGY